MTNTLHCMKAVFPVAALAMLIGCAAEGGVSRLSDSTRIAAPILDAKAADPTGVVDKHCARIVQPFLIGDNVGALAQIAIEMKLDFVMSDRKTNTNVNSGKQIGETVRRLAKQLNWLPMDLEVDRGRTQHEMRKDVVAEGKKTADEYAYARAVLDELLANVGEPHDYKFQLFLLDQRGENAEARPGGYLYVARPLVAAAMKADREKTMAAQKKGARKQVVKGKSEPKTAEGVNDKRMRLYFALAHEVAHVLQRHETKHLQSQIVDSITATNELYDLIKSSKEKPAAILKYAANVTSLFAKHYAQQELHADACAVRLLHNTFANEQKVEAALQAYIGTMSKELEPDPPQLSSGSNAEQYLSSVLVLVKTETERHPNTKARTDNLHAMVAQVKSGKLRMETSQ